MAGFQTFNVSNVLANVDAIQTARLRKEMYGNALADRELQMQDRERARADEQALRAARTDAWQTGNVSGLAGLSPQEAVAIRGYFDSKSEAERAREIAAQQADLEKFGKLAAWVQAAADPKEAAQRWGYARASLSPEQQKSIPEQYDPMALDAAVAQMQSLDGLLADIQAGKGQARYDATIGGPGSLGGGLIASESGGNWQAQNAAVGAGGQVGHFGRGQFGIERLNDAKRAGIIPASTSAEQFMANPDMQVRVEDWHRRDILGEAMRNGTYGLIGQTINGVPVTEQGLVNVAHLGGKEGAKRFFESGGKYNPADANGTRLSDYLAMGAQEGGGQPQGQQQPAGPQMDPTLQRLLQAYGDPALSDPQREGLKLAIELLKPGEDFTLGNTRFTGTGQEIASVPPDAPQIMGPIPAGYRVDYDEQGRPLSVSPIPGSPAAMEADAARQATEAKAANARRSGDIVLEDIARTRAAVEGAPWYSPAVGLGSSIWQNVGGSPAVNVKALTDTIRANIGFDRLNQMRAESPTGGALGQVTERELAFLQSVLGSLEQSQSEEQFLQNLDRLNQVYGEIVHGPGGAPAVRPPAGGAGGGRRPEVGGQTKSGVTWGVVQ